MPSTSATTIRRERQARGWSQYKLAERVSVTQPAIYLWESDQRTPRPRYAAALERALDLPAGSILENENDPQRRNVEGREEDHAVAPTTNEAY